MNMFYVIFVPFVLLCSGLMAYLMNRIRVDTDNWVNHVILLIVASIPYMYVVGRFSNKLAFDSMLFYILWLVGFWGVMLFTPEGEKMTSMQVLGLGISVLGLIMVKVCG